MDFGQIMQQAKMMGEQAKTRQEEMQKKRFEGTAGGGMVKATMNGSGTLVGLNIEKSVINPEDPEMLCDLVIAAVNDAQKKVSAEKADGLKELTGGFDLSALGIDLSKMF